MLVFAAQATPRTKYILDYLLTHRLGLSYKLTDNPEYFHKSPSLRIHYGTHLVEGCFNIPCMPLLFEEKITEQPLHVSKSEKWPFQFFQLPYENIPDFRHQTCYLSFDFFAASFYLLSRYEEYLPGLRDEHNRFRHQDSLAYQQGFLEIPLIDIWLNQFAELLKKQYPELVFKENHFKQINTIDIDFAYKYKGHGMIALGRKFAGSLLRLKPDTHSLFAPMQDPYDSYDFIIQEASKHNIETLFFLLLADYGGKDKNIAPLSPEMRALASKLSENFTCGIHPSYKATLNSKSYLYEHQVFETLCQQKPNISRHHFLKIKLPESYDIMQRFGIQADYSLAYSNALGFRASTAHPFPLFDLISQKTSEVWLHSACIMDSTLKHKLQLTVPQAKQKIKELKEQVRAVNGEFISIWHNSSFDPKQGWAGWEEVYTGLFE